MKKVISLSAVIMLGYVAFAQDTTTTKSNANPNNNLDTMSRPLNQTKDTSTKNWNSPKHTDSTGTNTGSNTMSSGTGSNNSMSSDSSNSTGTTSSNGSNSTMSSDSSSMSTNSNHSNMDSMSKTSGSQSNTSNSTSTTTTNAATITADSIKAYEKTLSDRVMMKDDKMYMLKDGEATPLEKSYKLSSGAVVSTLGTVKYPGGRVITLKNGQFIEIKPTTTTQTEKTKKSTKAVVTKKKVKSQSK